MDTQTDDLEKTKTCYDIYQYQCVGCANVREVCNCHIAKQMIWKDDDFQKMEMTCVQCNLAWDERLLNTSDFLVSFSRPVWLVKQVFTYHEVYIKYQLEWLKSVYLD